MSALNGWHIGERTIHHKLGHENNYSIMNLFRSIDGDLPSEHAIFHSTRLPFIPVVTLDSLGRPWGSILAGKDGNPGFVRNSQYNVLSVDAKLWPGEPLIENAKLFRPDVPLLVAGIGIEFPTRRRNKFAGLMTRLEKSEEEGIFHMDFTVNQALGNCPKYINTRDLVSYPQTSPRVHLQKQQLSPTERLPEEVISLIQQSDTVFLGTTYQAPSSEALLYPSHLGMNQRGGRKGFIRVVPSDGRTIVVPDFSGNRFMTSLGNIEATPLASLTFTSFTTGDILYITGDAKNLYSRDAQNLMPFQNTLTTVHATGYTLVLNALPVRQPPNTTANPSPYSPPIRLLAEEAPKPTLFHDPAENVSALLTSIAIHSPDIATFTWEASRDLPIVPGQAIIMDFTPLLGSMRYQHMAPGKPTSVNDDRIRTWTVSSHYTSSSSDDDDKNNNPNPRSFALTMREKPGGAATGALFSIARKLAEVKPEVLGDSRPLELSVGVVGVTGDFVLLPALGSIVEQPPPPSSSPPVTKQLLWIAGGIGVTPFLAMLGGLGSAMSYEIDLVLATREPEVLLLLLTNALRGGCENRPARFCVDVFSGVPVVSDVDRGFVVRSHEGRVRRGILEELEKDKDNHHGGGPLAEREVYVCGPIAFEEEVVEMLGELGVGRARVKRENFAY